MQTVVKSRAARSLQILPGTLCPFLYQTRTITSQRARPTRPIEPPASSDQSHQDGDTTLTFLQRKARDVEARRGAIESTITPSEREIFTNIMKTFGAKIDGISLSPSQPSPSELKSEQNKKSQPIKQKPVEVSPLPQSEPSSAHAKNTNIDDILSLFAPADTTEQFSAFSNSTNDSDLDPETDSSTFSSRPNSQNVRRAALQSLQYLSKTFQTSLNSPTSSPEVALWHVLEQEIFPLMNFLQTHRSPLNVNLYQQPISSFPLESLPPCISGLGETPFLPLITMLYPAATLLALRTCIAHIPTSGLILALLPKIRSLGPASYLLAGSTHFFNALMYVHWMVYSDLRSVYMLLSEMRRNGVEYDQGTLNLIEEISVQREQETAEGEGKAVDSRARDWWGLKRQDEGWHKLMNRYRFDILKEGRERKVDDGDYEHAIDREIK